MGRRVVAVAVDDDEVFRKEKHKEEKGKIAVMSRMVMTMTGMIM